MEVAELDLADKYLEFAITFFREKREAAEALIVQTLLAIAPAPSEEVAQLIAKRIYNENSPKFDMAIGSFCSWQGAKALSLHLPYAKGCGEVVLYCGRNTRTEQVELVSGLQPKRLSLPEPPPQGPAAPRGKIGRC